MKKGLLVEAVALTLPASALLAYALPFIALGLVGVFVPIGADTRSFAERFLGLLPYVGGFVGLVSVWYYAVTVARGRTFKIDWKYLIAVAAGLAASWELLAVTDATRGALVCVPVWILAIHVTFLNWRARAA